MPVAWQLRDRIRRIVTAEHEVKRQALRLVIRDQRLSLNVRMRAQFELQKLPKYSHPDAIRNRCIIGGKAKGLIPEFRMSQISFRDLALQGEIPGVRKALW